MAKKPTGKSTSKASGYYDPQAAAMPKSPKLKEQMAKMGITPPKKPTKKK